jgi:hypothetical protein
MQKVDAPTKTLLNSFNLTGKGYTLIVPTDKAFVYNNSTKQPADIFQVFGVSPANLTTAEATAVRPCWNRSACNRNASMR